MKTFWNGSRNSKALRAAPASANSSFLFRQIESAPEPVLMSKNHRTAVAKGADLGLCAIPTDNIVDEDEPSSTRDASLQNNPRDRPRIGASTRDSPNQ
ncbi:MAG: hypothetical protein C5B49_08345 [Bdellovibrio sp.]|nr:MAG: hypothetical protein C5B49_08345 [Bdellovibrio sp.]